jgi:hypothetical protein
MAPRKGSKNAPKRLTDKKDGRPRVHNREQIAIDLVAWADKPDSINLCKFCSTYVPKIPASKIMQWAREDENFRSSYEIAKQALGYRREEWLNGDMLHVKAYDLNAKAYDPFLKEEHRQEAEFLSRLKQKEESAKQQINLNITDYSQAKINAVE